jgi:hypothetical protein
MFGDDRWVWLIPSSATEGRTVHVKLYKRDGDRLLYWEAWDCEGRATFHSGEIGHRGSTERIEPAADQSVESVIQTEATETRQRGYEPFDREGMKQVILSCPTGPDWTSHDEMCVARYLADMCDESLGWTGLGHCDGPFFIRGAVGVYSLVVDQELGIREIIAELRRNGCEGKDEEMVLSVPDGEGFRVVYTTGPPTQQRQAEPVAAPNGTS